MIGQTYEILRVIEDFLLHSDVPRDFTTTISPKPKDGWIKYQKSVKNGVLSVTLKEKDGLFEYIPCTSVIQKTNTFFSNIEDLRQLLRNALENDREDYPPEEPTSQCQSAGIFLSPTP
jgi:hypothetical protein